jgi:hypothetical protein
VTVRPTGDNPHDDESDATIASNALSPRLGRRLLLGWAVLAGGLSLGVVGIWVEHPALQIVALFSAVYVLAGSQQWLRRSTEAVIYPEIAARLGLTIGVQRQDFSLALPSRLLPRGHTAKATALFHANADQAQVQLAEIETNDGSDQSSDDVQGLVVQVHGLPAAVEFLLVDRKLAGPRSKRWPSVIDTSSLASNHPLSLSGRMYDLYLPAGTTEAPIAEALTAQIMDHAARLPPNATLYTAVASRGQVTVLLALKQKLLPTRGLFMSDESVMQASANAGRLLASGLDLGNGMIGVIGREQG